MLATEVFDGFDHFCHRNPHFCHQFWTLSPLSQQIHWVITTCIYSIDLIHHKFRSVTRIGDVDTVNLLKNSVLDSSNLKQFAIRPTPNFGHRNHMSNKQPIGCLNINNSTCVHTNNLFKTEIYSITIEISIKKWLK